MNSTRTPEISTKMLIRVSKSDDDQVRLESDDLSFTELFRLRYQNQRKPFTIRQVGLNAYRNDHLRPRQMSFWI